MATVNSDFVDVQLSAAGVAAVEQNGTLRITAAHMSYVFTPGTAVKVLTSEWRKVLSTETIKGALIFELAPPVVPAAKAGSTAKQQLKTLQAEEAQLQSEIAKEGN